MTLRVLHDLVDLDCTGGEQDDEDAIGGSVVQLAALETRNAALLMWLTTSGTWRPRHMLYAYTYRRTAWLAMDQLISARFFEERWAEDDLLAKQNGKVGTVFGLPVTGEEPLAINIERAAGYVSRALAEEQDSYGYNFRQRGVVERRRKPSAMQNIARCEV